MTNRRQFLQIGITATTWPLASTAARAAESLIGDAPQIHEEPLPLYKVIYDGRFAASRRFADRARTLGFDAHAIEGDMTRFWYDELYHEWKRGPAAIAGLTAHGAMFCFEQLGREQGLRVVFEAEHMPAADGAIAHTLRGPVAMIAESDRLPHAAAGWSRCMADVVARCPRGKAEIVTREAASAGVPVTAPEEGGDPLYTWVIAPARRA